MRSHYFESHFIRKSSKIKVRQDLPFWKIRSSASINWQGVTRHRAGPSVMTVSQRFERPNGASIEGKNAECSQRATGFAVVGGPQRFSRIFNHRNIVCLTQFQQWVEVGALTVQIHNNDGFRERVLFPSIAQCPFQCCRRHIPRGRFRVDKDRFCALV